MLQRSAGPKTDFERVIGMACANRRFVTELVDHPDFVDRLVVQGLDLSPTEQLMLKNLTEQQMMPHRIALWSNRTWEEVRWLGDLAEQLLDGKAVAPLPSPEQKPENYTQTRGLSARR